jgi:hypothetical protein
VNEEYANLEGDEIIFSVVRSLEMIGLDARPKKKLGFERADLKNKEQRQSSRRRFSQLEPIKRNSAGMNPALRNFF